MPKMFTVSVPYSGHVTLEIIADDEKDALEMVSDEIDATQPDLDDPEFDDSEAEVEEVRELTADELKQWMIDNQPQEAEKPTEGPKP